MSLFASLRRRLQVRKGGAPDTRASEGSMTELAEKLAESRGPNVTMGVPKALPENPVDGLVERAKGVRIVNTGREHDLLDKDA